VSADNYRKERHPPTCGPSTSFPAGRDLQLISYGPDGRDQWFVCDASTHMVITLPVDGPLSQSNLVLADNG
jgi:hypothetical protein